MKAYLIKRAWEDLLYLLEKDVNIYCDHAILVQIFAANKEVRPHVRGKLQRWALKMIGIRYSIEHIQGKDNLYADIVSRWDQQAVDPPIAI